LRKGTSSDTTGVPTDVERTGDFSAGSTFGGTISDQFFSDSLNARPGCSAAVAAAGGAAIAPGALYSDVFPGNKIPTACFDQTALDLMISLCRTRTFP